MDTKTHPSSPDTTRQEPDARHDQLPTLAAQISNHLFANAVDDMIIRAYEAARSSGTDEQRAHLYACVRRVEDSVKEIGEILAQLEQ